MEYTFRQSYFDPTQSKISIGPKIIKVDDKFTYIKEKDSKSELKFIQEIKFGNSKYYDNVASRDIESHAIFRANDFDDFVVIRKYNGFNYVFDRIDYMNVEYRKIH
jgi:hypothetical protein